MSYMYQQLRENKSQHNTVKDCLSWQSSHSVIMINPLSFPPYLAPFERLETLRVSRMYGLRAELLGNESAGGWAPAGQCLQQHDPRERAGGGGLITIHHCQCPGTDWGASLECALAGMACLKPLTIAANTCLDLCCGGGSSNYRLLKVSTKCHLPWRAQLAVCEIIRLFLTQPCNDPLNGFKDQAWSIENVHHKSSLSFPRVILVNLYLTDLGIFRYMVMALSS